MFVDQKVITPYGTGIITAVREDVLVVIPSDWIMAGGQKPTFYLNEKDVKPYFEVGTAVSCPFGLGIVSAIRISDGIYVVNLDNWQLADGKSPTLYLNESTLSKLSVKVSDNIPVKSDYTAQRIALSVEAKNRAAEFFKKSEWYNARSQYVESLNILQNVGDSMTNDEKARIFELSVLCNNNAALCSLKVEQFTESLQATKNSAVLIAALESRIPSGEVWQCLLSTGMTAGRLQKEWKKKTLFLMGKAQLGMTNFEEALGCFKQALALIAGDASPTMVKQADELRKLVADTQAKLTRQLRKEKATWRSAFDKNRKSNDVSLYSDPADKEGGTPGVSPMNSPKRGATVAVEEDELFLDLSKHGLKNIGTKKTGKVAAASSTPAAAPGDNAGALWKPSAQTGFLFGISFLLTAAFGVGYVMWSKRLHRW